MYLITHDRKECVIEIFSAVAIFTKNTHQCFDVNINNSRGYLIHLGNNYIPWRSNHGNKQSY